MEDYTTTFHCDLPTLTREDLRAIKQQIRRLSTPIQTPFGEILILPSNGCMQDQIRVVKRDHETEPVVRD